MKYNRKYLLTIKLILLAGLIQSCKKFVEIPNSKSQITSSAVFADSSDATSAVLGIYINETKSATSPLILNGGLSFYTGMSSDELVPNTGSTTDLQFYKNGLTASPSGGTSDIFWTDGYTLIYQANACIEGISNSKGLTISVKDQLLGEAKCFRALFYFNLANLYGAVPLVTSTSYQTNQSKPRAPVDSIYNQMIADLTSAQNLLSNNYPSFGKVRFNKFAAIALLAKVYLYHGDWKDAETAASQIINSGNYTLEPDLNNVFLDGSSEAILQLIPSQPGYETFDGATFVPSDNTIIPNYTISNFLLNAFESNDQRKIKWLNASTINGINYQYPYKYKLALNNGGSQEDYMLFRLGEQYLIRAEAEANLGDANATNDLNIIRNRAGLPNYAGAMDKVSLLTAIYHERQTELFCEDCSRWFDLKRTISVNMVMSIVTPAKGGGQWNPDWALYPIPFSQIQTNSFLKQNPGY